MKRYLRIITLSVAFATAIVPLQSLAAFTVPPNDGYVTDVAHVLSAEERASLASSIQSYATETSNEIAIVILPLLDGVPIEDVGLQIGRAWGVGSTKNNGILIVVGYEEREVRIDVGYGLEGAVPDIVASGIIDTDIVPKFREGAYFGGLSAALTSLQKHIGGEYTAERYVTRNQEDSPWAFLFFFAFILFQWLLAIMGRTKSWWLGGVFGALGGILLVIFFTWWLSIPLLILLGLFLDFVVSKNYSKRGHTSWWAGGGFGPGGGFGGGSGGGFGGFGGGSFGGGGASGRW